MRVPGEFGFEGEREQVVLLPERRWGKACSSGGAGQAGLRTERQPAFQLRKTLHALIRTLRVKY